MHPKAFGYLGEQKALEFLLQKRLVLLARNWQAGRGGEIDLVMRSATHLIFIEVKTRKVTNFLPAEMSVTLKQQRKLVEMAQRYLRSFSLGNLETRFDVVGVTFVSQAQYEIVHVEEAFYSLGT